MALPPTALSLYLSDPSGRRLSPDEAFEALRSLGALQDGALDNRDRFVASLTELEQAVKRSMAAEEPMPGPGVGDRVERNLLAMGWLNRKGIALGSAWKSDVLACTRCGAEGQLLRRPFCFDCEQLVGPDELFAPPARHCYGCGLAEREGRFCDGCGKPLVQRRDSLRPCPDCGTTEGPLHGGSHCGRCGVSSYFR